MSSAIYFNLGQSKILSSGTGLMHLRNVLYQANTPFTKQALVFTCLQYKSFENTVEKGEIARNEQFLLFPLCFLPD